MRAQGGRYSPPMNICSVSFRVCHCEVGKADSYYVPGWSVIDTPPSTARYRSPECHCEAAKQPWQSVPLNVSISGTFQVKSTDCHTSDIGHWFAMTAWYRYRAIIHTWRSQTTCARIVRRHCRPRNDILKYGTAGLAMTYTERYHHTYKIKPKGNSI